MLGARLTAFALALALLPAVQASPGMELEFTPPGHAAGDLSGTATWAFLLLRPEDHATIEVAADDEARETNRTSAMLAETRSAVLDSDGYPASPSAASRTLPPFGMEGTLGGGRFAYVYVEGALAFQVAGSADLRVGRATDCVGDLAPDLEAHAVRARRFCPEVASAFLAAEAGSGTVRLGGQGVGRIEWMGAEARCGGAASCPQGGGEWQRGVQWGGAAVHNRHQSSIDLQGRFNVSIEGVVAVALLGAPRMDLALSGWARLPEAAGAEGCPPETCLDAGDRTLRVAGDVVLAGLRPSEGRLAARLEGRVEAAAMDETPVLLAAAAAGSLGLVGAAVAVGFGLWALVPFLTRMAPEDALKNARRRALHDYVVRNPGATFREALRGSGVAAGTGYHHVAMLKRCGLLMVRRHRQTVRLFPNHGQFDQTWPRVVLLRDPALRQLHGLVARLPGASQRRLLDDAQSAWGWSRSTTQHRLARLVAGGAAAVQAQGRFLHYTAVEPAPPRPPGLHAVPPTGPPSPWAPSGA